MKIFDFHNIIEAFNGFIETKVELLKLDAREELTVLVAKLFVILLVGLFFTLVIGFFSLGLAFALNDVLESSYLGLVIVGSFYLILATILYLNRALVIKKVVERQKEVDAESSLKKEQE